MYVYPAPGILTRDPVKKDLLPESGREVGDGGHYWLRRLADGDVTTVEPGVSRALALQPVRSTDE